MKKFLALLMAAVMTLGVAGCADSSEDKLVIGITYYEPMNYLGDDGELTGFDTEFTKAVCEKIGATPDFQVINWDNKITELQSKNIDLIWNGMTVKAEYEGQMIFSTPYIRNKQVVVIKKENAEKYPDLASITNTTITAEVGSAGESVIKGDATLSTNTYLGSTAQKDVLMEIKAGTTEVGVIDYVMAKASIGEGTDYADLMYIEGIELGVEEYAVGIRVEDTELQKKINDAMAELAADGTIQQLAEKYGLSAQLAF